MAPPVEPITKAEPPEVKKLTPELIKSIRDLVISAKGGNPEAQQTLNEFLNFKDDLERSNYPRRMDLQIMSYYAYFDQTLFKGLPDNPAKKLVKILTSVFNGLKSKKSDQFVEMMKQTPTLVDLQNQGEPAKRSLADKIMGRNKPE